MFVTVFFVKIVSIYQAIEFETNAWYAPYSKSLRLWLQFVNWVYFVRFVLLWLSKVTGCYWLVENDQLMKLVGSYPSVDVYVTTVLVVMSTCIWMGLRVYYVHLHRANVWNMMHELVQLNVDDFFSNNAKKIESLQNHIRQSFQWNHSIIELFKLLSLVVYNFVQYASFWDGTPVKFRRRLKSFPINYKPARMKLIGIWLFWEVVQVGIWFFSALMIVVIILQNDEHRKSLSLSTWIEFLFVSVLGLWESRYICIILFNNILFFYGYKCLFGFLNDTLEHRNNQISHTLLASQRAYLTCKYFLRQHNRLTSSIMNANHKVLSYMMSHYFYTTIPFNINVTIYFLLGKFHSLDTLLIFRTLLFVHFLGTLFIIKSMYPCSDKLHASSRFFVPLQFRMSQSCMVRLKLKWMAYHEIVNSRQQIGVQVQGAGVITKTNFSRFLLDYIGYMLVAIKFFKNTLL